MLGGIFPSSAGRRPCVRSSFGHNSSEPRPTVGGARLAEAVRGSLTRNGFGTWRSGSAPPHSGDTSAFTPSSASWCCPSLEHSVRIHLHAGRRSIIVFALLWSSLWPFEARGQQGWSGDAVTVSSPVFTGPVTPGPRLAVDREGNATAIWAQGEWSTSSSRRRATSRHRSRGHPLLFDRCRGRRAGRISPSTHRATWSRSGDDSTEPTIASRRHDTWPRPTRGRRRSISRRPAIIPASREWRSIRRATPSPSGGPSSRQPRRSCRPRDWLRRQEPGVACRTSSPQTRSSPRSLSPATLPAMP